MANLISQADYAAHRGVSRAAVTKAIQSGRIDLINGKIDPRVADIQWSANTDKAQAARANAGKLREPTATADQSRALPADGDVQASEYMAWKARKEKADALRSELELATKSSAVYDKAGVDRAARTAGRMLRDQILAIPARVAAELANIAEPHAIESRLRDELRAALLETEKQAMQPAGSGCGGGDTADLSGGGTASAAALG